MSLTAADVAEIMRLVEQSNFDELTLEMDGIKLSLKRGVPAEGSNPRGAVVGAPTKGVAERGPPSAAGPPSRGVPASHGGPPSPGAPASHGGPLSPGAPAWHEGPPSPGWPASPEGPVSLGTDTTVAATADPNVHGVASPLLGTFYRAPKPGAPPFVEVGAQVEEETVVAIIEVMKLMNTVRAGVRGTVTEILVADGALAEYGETLLRVRKAG